MKWVALLTLLLTGCAVGNAPPGCGGPSASTPHPTSAEAQLEEYCTANACFKALRKCISKATPSQIAQPAKCAFVTNADLDCWRAAGNCGSCNQGDPGRLRRLILQSFGCALTE